MTTAEPPDPPPDPVQARVDKLLDLVRTDPPRADPGRTAETVRIARWQFKARRALGEGRGVLAAFAEALATLLGMRGHDRRR